MPKNQEATTYGQRDLQRQQRQRHLRGEPPPDTDHWRPQTRGDCKDGPRPCPFVGCKYNLFLDITPKGGLRVPHGENPESLNELKESCALDVADRGGLTLEAVARLQMITRERVRQIELGALEQLKETRNALEVQIDARRMHSAHVQELTMDSVLAKARARPKPDLSDF